MFGFLFGVACVAGLYWHFNFGGHRGGRRRGHRRWAQRHMLRRVYDALDTSPSQERVIEEAVSELEDEGRNLRTAMNGGREALADAVRGAEFEREGLADSISKQDAAFDGLRGRVLDAIARVHSVLDEEQRRALSRLLRDGFGGCHRRRGLRGAL